MKKIFTIITMLVVTSLQAQTSNDIYLIGVTSNDIDSRSGIIREELALDKYSISPPIFITIRSDSKEYKICFVHVNFNVNEIAKIRPADPEDKQEIIEKPLSFLETINPIDLNEMNYEWQTAEEAWAFGESLSMDKMREQGKKIYFIDRADLEGDTIKLIEISYFYNNRPKGITIIIRDENGNIIDSH